jgi:hypothetical protein
MSARSLKINKVFLSQVRVAQELKWYIGLVRELDTVFCRQVSSTGTLGVETRTICNQRSLQHAQLIKRHLRLFNSHSPALPVSIVNAMLRREVNGTSHQACTEGEQH